MNEGNVLFNNILNTLFLRLYDIGYMVKDHSERKPVAGKIHRLLFSISSKDYFYASSHRQDNTYNSLWYTSHGTLAGTKNSSMGPPSGIDPTTHHIISGCFTMVRLMK